MLHKLKLLAVALFVSIVCQIGIITAYGDVTVTDVTINGMKTNTTRLYVDKYHYMDLKEVDMRVKTDYVAYVKTPVGITVCIVFLISVCSVIAISKSRKRKSA